MTSLIPFHGTQIVADLIDGTPYIAIKPLCESLGIDSDSQIKRLKRQPWASTVVMTVQLPGDNQARGVTMIDRRTFTMWLATIQTSRIKDDAARDLLTAYQCEAADVLDQYFNEGAAINPNAEEHRLMATIHHCQAQMELAQASKGLIHPDHLEAKARIILAVGMGERPEIDAAHRPLYTQDYLRSKNLSAKRMKSVAGTFGKRTKKAYIQKFGREPMKYDLNLPNGQIRQVCAYIEADRWLLDEVWNTYYAPTTGTQGVLS